MMKKLLKDCYYEESRIWYAAYLGDPRTKIGWFRTDRFGSGDPWVPGLPAALRSHFKDSQLHFL